MKTMLLFLVLAVGTTSNLAQASEDVSQNEIRKLVQQGKLLSLESILLLYPADEFGRLLDLEAEREHGVIVYELKFLRANGQVIEMKIDARNGSLLKQEIED